MNPDIKQALSKVRAEENRLQKELKRLQSELDRLQAVRIALSSPTLTRVNGTVHIPKRAPQSPWGVLDEAILSVLDRRTPRSRKEIQEAIEQSGYAYSLSGVHVTKHLIRLTKARQVKRVGDTPRESAYLLGVRK